MNSVIDLLINRLQVFVDKPVNSLTISNIVAELQSVTYEEVKEAIEKDLNK